MPIITPLFLVYLVLFLCHHLNPSFGVVPVDPLRKAILADNITALADAAFNLGSDIYKLGELDNQSYLHLAIHYGHLKSIHKLIKLDRFKKLYGAIAHLQYAISIDQCQLLPKLIEYFTTYRKTNPMELKDLDDLTLLSFATATGNIACVKALIEVGADRHAENSEGSQPIHVAATFNHPAMIKYLHEELGADVNVVNVHGFSPLHLAAVYGRIESIKMLLKLGADVDLANHYDETPLVSSTIKNEAAVVELLYKEGADVSYNKNKDGLQPLHYAAANNAVDVARLLVGWGVDVDTRDDDDYTPLFFAIAGNGGSEEMIETLIDLGGDIYATTNDELNPIDLKAFALDLGNDTIVKLIERWQAGPDPDEL